MINEKTPGLKKRLTDAREILQAEWRLLHAYGKAQKIVRQCYQGRDMGMIIAAEKFSESFRFEIETNMRVLAEVLVAPIRLSGNSIGIDLEPPLIMKRQATASWSPSPELCLEPGDPFLELHLLAGQPRHTMGHLNRSMALMADYAWHLSPRPKCVLGITYERLARASQRFGFKIVEQQLPPEALQIFESYLRRNAGPVLEGRELGGLYVCYQTTEDLCDRYYDYGLDK